MKTYTSKVIILLVSLFMSNTLQAQCFCDTTMGQPDLRVKDKYDPDKGWRLFSNKQVLVKHYGLHPMDMKKRARIINSIGELDDIVEYDYDKNTVRFLVRPNEQLLILRDSLLGKDRAFILEGIDKMCVILNCSTTAKYGVNAFTSDQNTTIATVNSNTESIKILGQLSTKAKTFHKVIEAGISPLKEIEEWNGFTIYGRGFFNMNGSEIYSSMKEELNESDNRNKYKCSEEDVICVMYSSEKKHAVISTKGITVVTPSLFGKKFKFLKWDDINYHIGFELKDEGSKKVQFVTSGQNNIPHIIDFSDANLTAEEIVEGMNILLEEVRKYLGKGL